MPSLRPGSGKGGGVRTSIFPTPPLQPGVISLSVAVPVGEVHFLALLVKRLLFSHGAVNIAAVAIRGTGTGRLSRV